MDRPVALNANGSATLRTGRFYRALVVVNGEPGPGEFTQALGGLGFATKQDLGITWPGNWPAQKPKTWPAEHPPELYANEFLVRASGSFVGPTREVAPDRPIVGGGTFTIAQLWDCGPALASAAHERQKAPEDIEQENAQADAANRKDGKTGTIVVVAALAAVLGWRVFSGSRDADREKARVGQLHEKATRIRRAERVNALLTKGHSQEDAEILATDEELSGFGEHELDEAELEELEHHHHAGHLGE